MADCEQETANSSNCVQTATSFGDMNVSSCHSSNTLVRRDGCPHAWFGPRSGADTRRGCWQGGLPQSSAFRWQFWWHILIFDLGWNWTRFFFFGGMHPAPWMPIITSADACVAPCWTGWKTQWAQRAQRLKPTAAGWRACCRLRLSGLSRSGLGRLGRLGFALFLAQLLCAPDDAWSDHRGSGCV